MSRKGTFTWIFVLIQVVIGIAVTVALTAGLVFLVLRGVQAVQERGLKNIVEEIWEGPDEDE